MFAIAHVEPQHAGPALLLAALMAQFVVDWTAAAVMFAGTRSASMSSLLGSSWVYGIDASLSGSG